MGYTIRDVALKANVSISTVSRVLNDTCPVGAEKRIRVEHAVEELGYTPNPAARSLLKRETGGLGVLLPYVTGEFFSGFLNGVDYTAKELGYFLLISTAHDELLEWRAAVKAVYRRVDGLIVMAPQLTPRELNLESDVSTVFVNTAVDGRAAVSDVINFENAPATYAGARYLQQLGHRRIVYLRGPKTAFDASERAEGFRRAMTEAGCESCSIVQSDYHQEGGYRATVELLAGGSRPTAIMAANDYCAVGVIRALREKGLSVPADVSVMGFDDVATSEFVEPALTSLRVPIRQIGVDAVKLLVSRAKGLHDGPPTQRNLPVELVIRASTAPPPSSG